MPDNNNNKGSHNNGGSRAEYEDMALLPLSDPEQRIFDDVIFANSVFELELYRDLNTASDIAVFRKRILAIVNRLGFSDYSFSRPFSQCEPNREFLTVADEIVDCYTAEDFYPHDMNVHYAREDDRPIFQSTIERYLADAPFSTKTFRRCRDLYRMLRRHGYFDYYFVPTMARTRDGSAKDRGLFAVTLKDCPSAELQSRVGKSRPLLHLLADAIADIGALKFPELFIDYAATEKIEITSRPLRLLTVLAQDDVTLSEAADKLCISIHTANQHVAAARKALDANTTTGAVCQAVKVGLIRL